jgi:hypothetical protein
VPNDNGSADYATDASVPAPSLLSATAIAELRRLARDEFDPGAIAELGQRAIPLLFETQEHADRWLAQADKDLPKLQVKWLPKPTGDVEGETPDQLRARLRAEAEAETAELHDRRMTAENELERRRRAAEGTPVKRVEQPSRAGRRRDQPLPTITEGGVCVQDEVMAYIDRRKTIGIERYGTVLQPNNGRDGLRDLFEELVDATQYAAQLLIERDGKLP